MAEDRSAGARRTRRWFLVGAAGVLLAGAAPGCGARPEGATPEPAERPAASLAARPGEPTEPFPAPGTHPLDLGQEGEALLHVPPGLTAGEPAPLVLTLHGAGGDAAGGLALLQAEADERGLLLLAPSSRGPTWDAVRGGFGPDLRVVDRALRRAFGTVPVDGGRIAVAGFSDGASYALGLGLANGELFDAVLAFSPGFVPETSWHRPPRVFVSHGTGDDVLPVDRTSRRIVPALREEGVEVTYREFPGPHALPPEIAREALDLLGWEAPG
ncbi:alpha/beta hydrolase [Blastococcus sp. SYSU DS0510]